MIGRVYAVGVGAVVVCLGGHVYAIAVILNQVIKTWEPFADLGHKYFEELDRAASSSQAVRRLERLGHRVTLEAR